MAGRQALSSPVGITRILELAISETVLEIDVGGRVTSTLTIWLIKLSHTGVTVTQLSLAVPAQNQQDNIETVESVQRAGCDSPGGARL